MPTYNVIFGRRISENVRYSRGSPAENNYPSEMNESGHQTSMIQRRKQMMMDMNDNEAGGGFAFDRKTQLLGVNQKRYLNDDCFLFAKPLSRSKRKTIAHVLD